VTHKIAPKIRPRPKTSSLRSASRLRAHTFMVTHKRRARKELRLQRRPSTLGDISAYQSPSLRIYPGTHSPVTRRARPPTHLPQFRVTSRQNDHQSPSSHPPTHHPFFEQTSEPEKHHQLPSKISNPLAHPFSSRHFSPELTSHPASPKTNSPTHIWGRRIVPQISPKVTHPMSLHPQRSHPSCPR
jgi:hypothetical protein